ncbi:hypothetical protein NXW39_21980 [Bacteroides fragilis]|uniref:Uncharacterized protein n=1 Tax=Bacteroides fragilis TaxID=817 RepID=A0A9X9IPP0_BACFG|nr:hypothetical protein NXW39_21980 [Bacteroides fragilis]
MKKQLRSSFSTQGRRMAGARALWAANGMKKRAIRQTYHCHRQFVYSVCAGTCTST